VDDHSRDEVARKAGVEPEYVDRLVELGFLTPAPAGTYSTGDVRRTRWVRSFEESGVPLEGLAAAVRDGVLSFSYLDAAAFDRFAGMSATTFRELGERTGTPLTLLMLIREAFGYAEPRPDDAMLEDELSVASVIELQLAKGFRPAVIEQWLRVYADGLRRIAETETDWWRSEVEEPLLRGGMTESQMLQAQAEIGSVMTPLMERAIVSIYRGQQEHAWTKTAVEDVEDALEKAGLYRRPHRSPAICFLDITGYTRLTEERGDEAAADLAARLASMVRRSSQAHGGQPVKWLGDGVMFHFSDPAPSVVAALDMVAGVAPYDLPPAHVGIHTGPVVFQEGDYFGRTVNVASRIAEYARPGEVLVTQEIVDVAKDIPVSFTDVGPVELKGVSGSLRLHAARRAG
jgi:adenylate cyclase